MPLVIVKHFKAVYGEDVLEKMLEKITEEKHLSLTVNTQKINREELMAKLSDYSPSASEYTESGIILGAKIPPAKLPGFENGEFFVQDASSQIAVDALSADVGMLVVDVCAAPGGKSFGAAIKVKDTGSVFSFDIHESKLSLIDTGAKRLGLYNVKPACRDALSADEALIGKADRVICDAPCSGLGVLSKKPDIRYKDLSVIDELPPLQYSILCESAKYLKVGGIMLYSTCTLNPSENEDITDKFVNEHSNFAYEKISTAKLSSESGKLTLLPHIHGTDGFFIALIKRMD